MEPIKFNNLSVEDSTVILELAPILDIAVAKRLEGVGKGGLCIQHRNRKILVNFRVSENENTLIAEKMETAGICNKKSYLRKWC